MPLSRMVAVLLSASLGLSAVAGGGVAAGDLSEEEAKEGYVSLFDGKTLEGWQGSVEGYAAKEGMLVCLKGGNLLTVKEYGDFVFRFDFKVPPGGNNGVAIRTPPKGNPAYVGMEIQILDDAHERYKDLKPYQFHGSIYGVVPAERGHLKPAGQWNGQEIKCQGSRVKITLNGEIIVDADLKKIGEKTMDGQAHPGLKREKGHLGFLGHGAQVEFRNLRIKEL